MKVVLRNRWSVLATGSASPGVVWPDAALAPRSCSISAGRTSTRLRSPTRIPDAPKKDLRRVTTVTSRSGAFKFPCRRCTT